MSEAVVARPPSRLGWALDRLWHHRSARIGGAILAGIILCAAFADVVSPHDPNAIDTLRRLQPPSATNWLGTDEVGRDLASRLIHGTRYFLLICLITTLIAEEGDAIQKLMCHYSELD